MPEAEAAEPPRVASVHPAVWMVLIVPFGALGGFVGVGLTFLATTHGLSITEGALLNGAQLLSQWMKWLWAPLVDITLTPRRWHLVSTALTAAGTLAMSLIPLGPGTLTLLLAVIAFTSLLNTVVAMAIEACMTADTPPDQAGRVSAWYQAGNLGGTGLGGGLGLWLLETLPQPWMAGALMGALMLACCSALVFVRERPAAPHRVGEVGLFSAVGGVARDLVQTLRTTGGMLAALLLVLPVGTGAGSGVLTQAEVAAHWGAGAREVGLLQGTLAGLVTAAGCFAGGALCRRMHPRSAYAAIGLVLAAIGAAMALAPATVMTYIVACTVYNFAVGMAYAAYSATTLDAIGHTAGATKFSTMASLANFPIWWLGLLLGWMADHHGASAMLNTEAALGVIGVALFTLAAVRVRRLALAA